MSSTNNTNKENVLLSQDKAMKVTLEIVNYQNATGEKSTNFSFPNNKKIKFSLRYLNHSYFGHNYAMIFLHLLRSAKRPVTVRYRLALLNANGDKCETQEGVTTFFEKGAKRFGANLMIPRDYILKQENALVVNGKLIVYCEIEEFVKITGNEEVKQDLPDAQIVQDYQSLLESGKLSDASLIIKIGEKKLNVHKAILSARSKVFAAMFENDCEEKRQNRVEITDIPAEVCEQMLSYIYTGQIPDMVKYAADLFIAADKYELEHLKGVCERHLTTNLSIESVSKALLIADMHQAKLLKAKCIDYITDNMTKVMNTEGWKELTAARIELTLELLKKLAIKAKC